MKKLTLGVLMLIVGLCPAVVWAQEPWKVVVSILPQAELVKAVGKDFVAVSVMIPPSGNPHSYEPVPSQLVALSQADLYFQVGSGLEFENQWMNKIMALNPAMTVVNTSAGITLLAMGDHVCDGGGDHHHGGDDPHVWLSPRNAMVMVSNIRDALMRHDPQRAEVYRDHAAEMILKLSELQDRLREKLTKLENRTFLVFHPAWGYFADDFQLNQVAVEDSGKEPTPRQLGGLIQQAQKVKAKVVFVSPQFSRKSAETIAREIGGRVEFIDPLAADYFDNLIKTADILAGTTP